MTGIAGCVCALTLGVALSVPSLTSAEGDLPITVTRFSDRALVVSLEQGHANMLALSTEKGIVIFNTLWSNRIAAEYRRIIENEFGRDDFVYVINTGAPLIRFGGNAAFPEAEIIAHEYCLEDMTENVRNLDTLKPRKVRTYDYKAKEMQEEFMGLGPGSPRAAIKHERAVLFRRMADDLSEPFVARLPTMTFSDRLTLDLGNMTLELVYFGNRTILARIPEERIVMPGDAFHPVHILMSTIYPVTQDVPRWLDVLDGALDGPYEVEHVVGHWRGIWGREDLVKRRDYIRQLWDDIAVLTEEGVSYREAKERLSMDTRYAYLTEWDYYREHGHRWVLEDHLRNVRAFWKEFHEPASEAVGLALGEAGLEGALRKFEEIRADTLHRYFLDESGFNRLGYRLLSTGDFEEAVEIFKMNAELHPDSWNAWDSLGEAYMCAGERDRAITYYEKSVDLNPDNQNGMDMLERLRAEK